MADAGELVNILAVCQSPTLHLREQLIDNIARLELARSAGSPAAAARPGDDNPEVLRCRDSEAEQDQDDAGRLAAFGITMEVVRARMAAVEAEAENKLEEDDADVVAAYETRQRELVVAYNTEVMNAEGDEARCRERKEDFAAAIHKWVEKLAEKRVLQTLAEG